MTPRGHLRRRSLAAAGAALAALGATAALALWMDHHLGYRSPLAGEESRWTPRREALAELAEHRRRKEEERRRRAERMRDLTPEKMVSLGREIVHGPGLCFNCHRVGVEGSGEQGPDLAGIGGRAGERVPGLDATAYLAQSLYDPGAFVVDGYGPSMTAADEPPIDLDDEEILFVIAYLQSLGGEVEVSPETWAEELLPAAGGSS